LIFAFVGLGLFFATGVRLSHSLAIGHRLTTVCAQIMFTARLEGNLALSFSKCLAPVYVLVLGGGSGIKLVLK
jgi:hypothetical protein